MNTSYVSFELASQFVDMSKRMLSQRFDFNYNSQTQTLKLFPDPIQQNKEGYIVMGIKTVPPISELVGNWYVKRLALAKAKIILGLVRSKFEVYSFLEEEQLIHQSENKVKQSGKNGLTRLSSGLDLIMRFI